MRVAFNGSSLLSPLTGIGQYTYHLAHGLLAAQQVEVDFFYGSGWSKESRDVPLPGIASFKSILSKVLPSAYSLSRMVRQYRFTTGLQATGAQVYHEPNFLAFKSEVPAVITVHDLSWIRFPGSHPPERVRQMNKYFEPGLRRAKLILTDSAFVKRELIDVFAVPAQSIITVPLGVDSLFRPLDAGASAPVLSRHCLTHRGYMLAVGTLEPRKNLQAALSAFSTLPPALRRRCPMVVVGMSGWRTSAIEQQLAPLVAAGEVIQLGYVSRSDLAVIIAGAITLVYPSIYEGFGLPPLEAMACAVPVITSDVSSLPEVVGDTGLLVHPHDVEAIARHMLEMVEDPQRRDALGERALSRSREFSWDRCVGHTIDAYRCALDQGSSVISRKPSAIAR